MRWFIIAIIAQYVISLLVNVFIFGAALSDNNKEDGIPAMIKIAVSFVWICVGVVTLIFA